VARAAAAATELDRACPLGVCDGSGWILGPEDVARACECRDRRLHRARAQGVSSVIPARYRGVSFERPPVTEIEPMVVRVVRTFVEELDENLASGRGLWLMGDTGTGKTTLAMLVSKAAIDAGHSVAIYSVPHLLAEIRDTYDRDPGERSYMDFFNRLAAVDLLHLEDVGAEKQTDWVLEQLYSLINERYEQQRSILVTTNLPFEKLEEQIGQRTASRIVEMCGDPVLLYGEDRRIAWDPARAATG
jgi:DNA replication protein DnaC